MLRKVTVTVSEICLAVALGCGSDGDDPSGGTSWDVTRGVKCKTVGSSYVTYWFKGNMMKQQSSFQVPGTESYDLQPNDTTYYKVVIKADKSCAASKIKPTVTVAEWKKKVVDAAARLHGTPGATMPGAPQCEQADLPDSMFMLPGGCKVP